MATQSTPRKTQVRKPDDDTAPVDDGVLLPHERDEQGRTGGDPDGVIAQAQRDIERGLVDTDMRATPGLDAPQRDRLLREQGQRGAGKR